MAACRRLRFPSSVEYLRPEVRKGVLSGLGLRLTGEVILKRRVPGFGLVAQVVRAHA